MPVKGAEVSMGARTLAPTKTRVSCKKKRWRMKLLFGDAADSEGSSFDECSRMRYGDNLKKKKKRTSTPKSSSSSPSKKSKQGKSIDIMSSIY